MRKIILTTFILCILSSQVLGTVTYGNIHMELGSLHALMHEFGQPHSHDHDDASKFEMSYSDEAVDHIGQDMDCSVVALVNTLLIELTYKKPSDTVIWYANNWSPPFIHLIKPPPRY